MFDWKYFFTLLLTYASCGAAILTLLFIFVSVCITVLMLYQILPFLTFLTMLLCIVFMYVGYNIILSTYHSNSITQKFLLLLCCYLFYELIPTNA